jgi:hypothetical protein
MTASHWRFAVGSVEYRIWKYICQLWDRQPHWTQMLKKSSGNLDDFQFNNPLCVVPDNHPRNSSAPGGLTAVNYKLQYLGMFFLSFS